MKKENVSMDKPKIKKFRSDIEDMIFEFVVDTLKAYQMEVTTIDAYALHLIEQKHKELKEASEKYEKSL